MGQTNSKQERVVEKEKQIMANAITISNQLNIAKNQTQLREQRHLIARILLYGQEHLIDHLKTLSLDRKKLFIRILRTLDYQTIDLLYQNNVSNIMATNPINYTKYDCLHIKQIKNEEAMAFLHEAKDILDQKKFALFVFVGGSSSRFQDETGKIEDKAFYTENEEEDSLLEIVLRRIEELFNIHGEQELFIIHSEHNHQRLNKVLTSFKTLKPKKLIQNILYVVNKKGKVCLKGDAGCEIIHAPNGCGNFYRLRYGQQNILQYLKKNQIEYIHCMGIENINLKPIDPLILGMLSHDNCEAVFKCTYPETKNQNLKRIVLDSKKGTMVIQEYQSFRRKVPEKQLKVIQESPIWINSVMINVNKFAEYLTMVPDLLARKKQKMQLTTNDRTFSYWDPQLSQMVEETCSTFQTEISDLLTNEGIKTKGIMVEREEEFMPVISINDEHIWREAYKEYKHKHQTEKVNEPANMSLVSMGEGNNQL